MPNYAGNGNFREKYCESKPCVGCGRIMTVKKGSEAKCKNEITCADRARRGRNPLTGRMNRTKRDGRVGHAGDYRMPETLAIVRFYYEKVLERAKTGGGFKPICGIPPLPGMVLPEVVEVVPRKRNETGQYTKR